MRTQTYFRKVQLADERIAEAICEVGKLRQTIQLLENNKEAPLGPRLETVLEKLWLMEDDLCNEIDSLILFKGQMRQVIDTVPTARERLVLRMRYLLGMSWEDIAEKLHSDVSSVRDWHSRGLRNVILPAKPHQL